MAFFGERVDARTAREIAAENDRLRAELLARDRKALEEQQAAAELKAKAERDAAAAAEAAAHAEKLEAARRRSWILYRFNQRADERPNDSVPLDLIFAAPPADNTWPPGESAADYSLGPVASEVVAEQGASPTKLHSLLNELRERNARVTKT